MTRRFPPPWSVEDIDAAFVVKDSTGQALTYVYFEEEPGRLLGSQDQALTKDEARRIALNIATPAGAFVEAVTREAEQDWR